MRNDLSIVGELTPPPSCLFMASTVVAYMTGFFYFSQRHNTYKTNTRSMLGWAGQKTCFLKWSEKNIILVGTLSQLIGLEDATRRNSLDERKRVKSLLLATSECERALAFSGSARPVGKCSQFQPADERTLSRMTDISRRTQQQLLHSTTRSMYVLLRVCFEETESMRECVFSVMFFGRVDDKISTSSTL